MKRILATVSAAALALTIVSAPKPAEAHPALIAVGWAVAIGFGGLLAGALIANSNHWVTPAQASPVASVPYATCHYAHRWVNGYRATVQVCVTEVQG
jgi:hypothetical protein